MGKKRRGGYVFVTWIGDHALRNVHVFKDGKLIVKIDLETRKAIEGRFTSRILTLIDELEEIGEL